MFNPCNPKYPLFTFAIALFVGGIPNPSSAAEFKFPDQGLFGNCYANN